jgi:flagellar basal-body rod protein FlgB
MLGSIFGGALEQLTRGLAFAGGRHEVLSRNIANADTPGYRAEELVADDLAGPQRSPSPGVVPASLLPLGEAERRPRLVYAEDGAVRSDGNDVNVERQLSRLTENQLFHHALVQTLTSQFTALKQAISGRV